MTTPRVLYSPYLRNAESEVDDNSPQFVPREMFGWNPVDPHNAPANLSATSVLGSGQCAIHSGTVPRLRDQGG